MMGMVKGKLVVTRGHSCVLLDKTKTKALKISIKKFKKKRPPAHFLAKAKDANQLYFFYVALQ